MLKRRKLTNTIKQIEAADLEKVPMHTCEFATAISAYLEREHRGEYTLFCDRLADGRCLVSLARLGLFLVAMFDSARTLLDIKITSEDEILFMKIRGLFDMELPITFRSEAIMSGFWIDTIDGGIQLSMPIRCDYITNLFANSPVNFYNVLKICKEKYNEL